MTHLITRRMFTGGLLASVPLLGSISAAKAQGRTVRISYVTDVLNESQMGQIDYMQRRMAKINEERDDITLEMAISDPQGNVDLQLTLLENVISINPDILIFAWLDKDAVRPLIKQIHDQGVTVIDLRDLNEPDIVSGVYYSYHEPTYAQTMTSWLMKYLDDNPDVVLNAGLLYGGAAQTPQLARCDLVKEIARQRPDRVKILVEQFGDWDTSKAQNIAEDWLTGYPTMNYMAVANTNMASGVVEVLKSARRIDDFLITSFDLSDTGIQLVHDGFIDALVGNNNPERGSKMVDYALALLEGTTTEKVFALKNANLLDKTNVDAFLEEQERDWGYVLLSERKKS